MVGISSLADSSTGEEAAASGIGRYFRGGRRLGGGVAAASIAPDSAAAALTAAASAAASSAASSLSGGGGLKMRLASDPSGAWSGGRICCRGLALLLLSRELISDSICERNSLEARRNSPRKRATCRPISGIFLGPKRISAKKNRKIISPEKPKFIALS